VRVAIVLQPEEYGRLVDVARSEHRRASDQVHHWVAEKLARSEPGVTTAPSRQPNSETPGAARSGRL